MLPALNHIERRILGALVEKALAQPQYYPMTLNALIAACNQKNNRDLVMDLDEDAVWNTLERLRAGGLVSRLLPGGASRVERYRHELKEQFGWEKPQRAVMAELLLRGPQTIGELRTHCARMYPFESVESVAAIVDALAGGDRPALVPLPRAPGQSAVRYAHTLYPPDEAAHLGTSAAPGATLPAARAATAGAPEAAAPAAPTPAAAPPPAMREAIALADRVAALESEVSDLRGVLADLQSRLARLESRPDV